MMIAKLKKTLYFTLLCLLPGLTVLGAGITAVYMQCEPLAAVNGTAENTSTKNTAASPGMNCSYHSTRLWGLWPHTQGSASTVQALVAVAGSTPDSLGGKTLALQTEGAVPRVLVSGSSVPGVVWAAGVVQTFNDKLGAGVAFTDHMLLFHRLTAAFGLIYTAIGCAALLLPWLVPPLPWAERAGSYWAAWRQRWQRTGTDTSYINLGLFAVPVWLGLFVLYIAFCLTVAYFHDWIPLSVGSYVAGSGPGLLGLIDLTIRLRTTHYTLPTALGLTVTRHASVIDRLTFAECGWYIPVFVAPVPLWLIGGGLTVIFLNR